ncbi:hypothetical protein D6D24_07904 [Aureobasidium pullulans]|uniref:C3H1-type domain-containing protein n=1 Tax=Aureobasidium pullulans TaxID=5580 RepID=A0A4S8VFW9_AURPU|nr:hypothetical protein D6D24_07904 [Aureobasidium pullulans]
MQRQAREIVPDRRQVCTDWLLGQCRHANGCNRSHHPNLESDLPSRKQIQYQVRNELGESCLRCLQGGLECDKMNRDPGCEDPCSECRHFGGDSCKCTLMLTASMNDLLWRQMLTREAFGFDLPQPKDKQAALSNGKVPAAMPDHKLKSNWHGDSKATLLERVNLLPPEVRLQPRAYMVPPRDNAAQRKRKRGDYFDINGRVKLGSTGQGSMDPPGGYVAYVPHGRPSPLVEQPFISRPVPDPIMGESLASGVDWITGREVHHYRSGHSVMGPPQRMATLASFTGYPPPAPRGPAALPFNTLPPRPSPASGMYARSSNATMPPPSYHQTPWVQPQPHVAYSQSSPVRPSSAMSRVDRSVNMSTYDTTGSQVDEEFSDEEYHSDQADFDTEA